MSAACTTVPARTAPAFVLDIVEGSANWAAHGEVEAVLHRAVAAAAAMLGRERSPGAELAVILTDDTTIRGLNRQWRGIDRATNVLSFAAPTIPDLGVPTPLGDVVLAYETIAREADEAGKPFADHVAHLAVHGLLHLLGYDHESDPSADIMERLECSILARLQIPDPYASSDPET